MTVTITVRQLKRAQACKKQVDLFVATFGNSVTYDTLEAFVNACQSHPFDYSWAASDLLKARARADYERTKASARADYKRLTAPVWADCTRSTDSAWADYERVRALAQADYERVTSSVFAALYWAQENRRRRFT